MLRPERKIALPVAGGLLAAFILLCAPVPGHAQAFAEARSALVDYAHADRTPAHPCDDLNRFLPSDVQQVQAEEIPAKGNTPGYCRVLGRIVAEVDFEVALPDRWNGRFYMIGNGGHAGESLTDPSRTSQRDAALAAGFAFAQTNTGHDSRKEPGASFVLSNPAKAIDYAYRAVHVTALTAKAFISRYYDATTQRAYWNSCSNGGRQGLIEAERYPLDFDGVIANAPWVSQTGFTLGAMWNQRAVAGSGLTAAKLALLGKQVMARCDAIDGVKDGLIDDPRKCRFDAHRDVPACPAGSDTPDCLTSAQADAVMKIYGGPWGAGRQLFPGYMPGSEAVVAASGFGGTGGANSAWMGMIVPAQAGATSADFSLAEGTMRFLVHNPPQPDYDTNSFDFDRDPPMLDAWSRKVDATSTDLNAFRALGGKLLLTYGWADQVLQPLAGVHYYEQLQKRYGSRTGEFARLFMVPGMTHCSGGNGTDTFDSVTAMVNWVEKGKPPASLAASRVVAGKVVRTRPLCPYPQVARYQGSGSIDEAKNFRCALP